MRIHRRGSAAALALCLGALTACGGSPGEGQAQGAQPPTSRPTAPGGADRAHEGPAAGQAVSLRGKVIVLDPGHNGGNGEHPAAINKKVDIGNGTKECDTTGTATNAGYNEHAFTWDVSKRLAKLLRAEGAKVVLTRKNDTGVGPCIDERAAIGNRAKADAALSVHADGASASAHGFHIIQPVAVKGHNAAMVPDAQRLGRELRDAYREETGIAYSTYRGKKALDPRSDLGGLNLSTVPKVFIECGNMRNASDAAKLSSAAFRQRIAVALANGFEAYFTG
ncbi:N-acetylmuramoyl-L-alanine amidase [Actinomadura viridis]|uniref:N-acetylmuramoyl-L-alanine amidase n=1 Tax=Actinomadura viridis TaxID=58110 RepID=A0A931DSL7_9ACTN|nr:N-acetylmuramoyl-L-alanine amidase [Actinomadura viridis]MBG6092715.1 N-acetylmuramoyl-L-alanine amidase [Actinomadura viridis]